MSVLVTVIAAIELGQQVCDFAHHQVYVRTQGIVAATVAETMPKLMTADTNDSGDRFFWRLRNVSRQGRTCRLAMLHSTDCR